MSVIQTNSTTSDTSPNILNIISTKRNGFPSTPSSVFRIQFQYPILYARRIRLLYLAIPNTLQVFNSQAEATLYGVDINNRINFLDSTLTEKIAFITPGTYTITDLLVEIKTQMDLASGVDTYTITYDNTTSKITFTSSNPNFELLWATGTNPDDSAWYELGFNQVDTGLAISHTSTRTINISGPYELQLRIAQFKNVVKDTKNFTSCFVIPLDVQYGDIKYWKYQDEYDASINCQVTNLTYLDVELISEFGRINLNGADWSCTLEFT